MECRELCFEKPACKNIPLLPSFFKVEEFSAYAIPTAIQ
jgi:hypothetical protein